MNCSSIRTRYISLKLNRGAHPECWARRVWWAVSSVKGGDDALRERRALGTVGHVLVRQYTLLQTWGIMKQSKVFIRSQVVITRHKRRWPSYSGLINVSEKHTVSIFKEDINWHKFICGLHSGAIKRLRRWRRYVRSKHVALPYIHGTTTGRRELNSNDFYMAERS
jgi:hypothetical protein